MTLEKYLDFCSHGVTDFDGFLDEYGEFQRFRCACLLTDMKLSECETRMAPESHGNIARFPERRFSRELCLHGIANQPILSELDISLRYRLDQASSNQRAIGCFEEIIQQEHLVLVTADFYLLSEGTITCYDPDLRVLPDRYAAIFGNRTENKDKSE